MNQSSHPSTRPSIGISDSTFEIFEDNRTYLLGLAYRMVGSVMEAEDIVQDAYLRFQAVAPETEIDSPRAYLTTVTTRLCLDHLKSARVQREEYVGPWLPEPLLTADAPSELVLQRESVSMAFLAMLERLSPVERAVFLLREVFDYGYRDIASIVEKSESNCRQLLSRARKYLANRDIRFETDTDKQQRLIHAFLTAIDQQDMEALTSLLAADIRWESDGGGKVIAATKPLEGQDKVIRFALGIAKKRPESLSFEFIETNGTQSILLRVDGNSYGIWNFTIERDRITNIWATLNPDKLRHLHHL